MHEQDHDSQHLQVILAVAANPNVKITLVTFSCLSAGKGRPLDRRPVRAIAHHVGAVGFAKRWNPCRRVRDPTFDILAYKDMHRVNMGVGMGSKEKSSVLPCVRTS